MNQHVHSATDLTKNQSLVMGELSKADGPLSAYAILDQLRDHGFRAPPQVYRALDKLVEFGLVHRLECLNAFVACRDPGCETHAKTFKVSEIADEKLTKHLTGLACAAQFALTKTTIELRGTCRACQLV